MDISEFTKQQGEFLKAENVENECEAVILAEAKLVHNDKYDTDRLHIPVEIKEKQFTFDASKTNSRTISDVLGDDTSKWIGKVLVLETYKTKTSDGKMVEAINVKQVKQE